MIWFDKDMNGSLEIKRTDAGYQFEINEVVRPRLPGSIAAKVTLIPETFRKLSLWVRAGAPVAMEANPKEPQTPAQVLREARDRIMALEADAENYKVNLRPAFRGGYSQCRTQTRDVLTEMIEHLEAGQCPLA